MASAYLGARRISETVTYGYVNPAVAFGITMCQLFNGVSEPMKYIWITCGFPFVGAIIAIIFHEFVYRKTQQSIDGEYSTGFQKGTLQEEDSD